MADFFTSRTHPIGVCGWLDHQPEEEMLRAVSAARWLKVRFISGNVRAGLMGNVDGGILIERPETRDNSPPQTAR